MSRETKGSSVLIIEKRMTEDKLLSHISPG